MHFCANFKEIEMGCRLFVKNMQIKNISDVVELPKNPGNPL